MMIFPENTSALHPVTRNILKYTEQIRQLFAGAKSTKGALGGTQAWNSLGAVQGSF